MTVTLRGVTPGYESTVSQYGSNSHLGHHFTVGALPRRITKIRTYYNCPSSTYCTSFKLAIINRNTQAIVYESPTLTVSTYNQWLWYSTPDIAVDLSANTQYVVAMLFVNGNGIAASSAGAVPAGQKDNGISDGAITWNQFTSNDANIAALCDTSYSNDGSYENGFEVTHGVPNLPPTAPTGLVASDATIHKDSLLPVTYQHNDSDGDPQVKTQARWRKAVV